MELQEYRQLVKGVYVKKWATALNIPYRRMRAYSEGGMVAPDEIIKDIKIINWLIDNYYKYKNTMWFRLCKVALKGKLSDNTVQEVASKSVGIGKGVKVNNLLVGDEVIYRGEKCFIYAHGDKEVALCKSNGELIRVKPNTTVTINKENK